MQGSLMTFGESQRVAWAIHNTAASKARTAGACWQCSAEIGCRATDKAELSRRTRNDYVMHAECEKRIQRGSQK